MSAPLKKKPAKKNRAAVLMGQARWAGVPEKERSRAMKAARRAPGAGRQRAKYRCYCGANAMTRALARAFDCCKKAGVFPEPKAEK